MIAAEREEMAKREKGEKLTALSLDQLLMVLEKLGMQEDMKYRI